MSRGQETRQAILDQALRVAGTLGLESITIGQLASTLGMSKSGLFAHFRSKQQLQIDVLQEAVERFVERVVRPPLRLPRGEPRVRGFFERWLEWSRANPGGCVIYNASSELSDRPGALRDFVQKAHRDWADTIERGVRMSMDEGHFRSDLDPEQFVFELSAIALGYHHAARLLEDEEAAAKARIAFEHLLIRAQANRP